MVDPNLDAYAQGLLQEAAIRHPLPNLPTLVWKRYRVTAGMAYYKIGVIGLSSIVLRDRDMVRTTLLHEYAHLLAVARHGSKAAGHGLPWKEAMRDLGQDPVVRHRYAVERNQVRQRVVYRCLRCRLEIVRSRRLPKRRHYVHATCGGSLRLHRVEPITGRAVDA